MMYKLYYCTDGKTLADAVLRDDGWCIPFDPANTDARQFAEWLQQGNKPKPAEDGDPVTDEWIAETIAKLLP